MLLLPEWSRHPIALTVFLSITYWVTGPKLVLGTESALSRSRISFIAFMNVVTAIS